MPMHKWLLEFSNAGFFKQFIFTFVPFSVLCLALKGAEQIAPTALAIALTFGPWAFLSLVFVLFFRFYLRLQNRRP